MKKIVPIKIISFALLVMLLSFVILPGKTAFAEDALTISAEATPASLSTAGKIVLNIVLDNKGDTASDITIKYKDKVLGTEESILSGQRLEFKYPDLDIEEEELDTDLIVTADYSIGTSKYTKAAHFKVGKDEEISTAVELSVESDGGNYSIGDTMPLSFKITNNGNAPLVNCKVMIPELEGERNVAGAAFAVEAGRTVSIEYDLILNSVSPINAVFVCESGESEVKMDFDTYDVVLIENSLVFEITPAEITSKYGENVEFNVKLTNGGQTVMSGITVLDMDSKNLEIPKTTLESGESIEFKYLVKAEESKEMFLSAKAVNDSGKAFSFNSDTIVMFVNGTASTSVTPVILSVFVDNTSLAEPGVVNFKLNIVNTTDKEYKNVEITEKGIGVIESLESIPAYTRAVVSRSVKVESTCSFEFLLKAIAVDGTELEVGTTPMHISVSGGNSMKNFLVNLTNGSNLLLFIGALIAVIIVILIVVLIILNNKDKNERENEDEDEDTLEQVSAERSRKARPSLRKNADVLSAVDALDDISEQKEISEELPKAFGNKEVQEETVNEDEQEESETDRIAREIENSMNFIGLEEKFDDDAIKAEEAEKARLKAVEALKAEEARIAEEARKAEAERARLIEAEKARLIAEEEAKKAERERILEEARRIAAEEINRRAAEEAAYATKAAATKAEAVSTAANTSTSTTSSRRGSSRKLG